MKRLVLLSLCAALAEGATPTAASRPYAEQMAAQYAGEYRIPADMVRAVIRVESNWNPGAVSSAGALGMMQLMPETAQLLKVDHPFWINQNIEGGTAYLAYLYRRFNGDWRLALAAYNAGPAVVEKRRLRYSSPGVFMYVSHVLAEYRALQGKGTNR